MKEVNHVLTVFVPMLYLATIFTYWLATDSERRPKRRVGLVLLIVTLSSHAMWIAARYRILGHLPLTTIFDSFSFLAVLISLTYLLVEMFTGVESTGFDLLLIPGVLTTWAAAFGPYEPRYDGTFNTPLFVLHTLPAVGGIAAITVSGVYGWLYIRLAREIQKKRFGRLFKRLPDLEILSRMNFWAGVIGLVLATAAIGWGATWYGRLFQQVRVTEPKIFLTLLVWTILLVPVGGKLFRRFSDKATATVAVVNLTLVIVSIVVSFTPGIGFHSHR
jgi:ABC-type uncharacterized transport system permease subunit